MTPSQLRAARGLANLSQKELAEHVGMTAQGIAAFEKGDSDFRERNREKIIRYLDKLGIELTEHEGVKRKYSATLFYEGKDEFREFFTDIYTTLRDEGGDICLYNGVPDLLITWLGADWYKAHAERMRKISHDYSFRIIVKEGEKNFIAGGLAEYRWYPKEKFRDKTIYMYGSKIAFINFLDDTVRVTVLKHKDFAESFQFMFDSVWENEAYDPYKGVES